MKTLTAEEYVMLEYRARAGCKICNEMCASIAVPFDSAPEHSRSVLTALVERGLLTSFQCQHLSGASHHYTNADGITAMTLYKLIASLGDLKLQGIT